ncbi:MAG: ABC transporter ATP-binding protein [Rubrivivax sp.]|nr:ABC transporter ATP-binding protein [Rubrivivax sp.]
MAPSGILADTLRLLLSEASLGVRARLAAAMLLVIAGALLSATAPLALKALVDALAAAPAPTGLPPSTLALGGVYLLALCSGRLFTEFRLLLTATAEQGLCARLSRRFFGHVLALPMAFHIGRQSGALVQSLRQASTGCQILIVMLVNGVAPVLVEVAAVLAVLLHLEQPALVLSFAASAAAYLTVCGIGALRLQARARAVSAASLDTHATLADSLINVEAIKCFNAEAGSGERFATASAQLETCWMRLHRQRARTGLAVTATFAVSMSASLIIAAHALGRGTLSIGGFVLVTVYMLQLVRPLEMLGAAARDVAQALEFVRPLLDVLRMPTEAAMQSVAPLRTAAAQGEAPTHHRGARAAVSRLGDAGLSLRGVHLAYEGGPPVLKGLDLEIAAGRTVAVVGASGSGKTSIVRLLLRLVAPQSGRILLGGLPIDALPVGALRAAIGLVPQDTVLFNASMAANIGIGRPGAQRGEIEEAARRAQLHDFITSLPCGYDTQVGERGLRLSGGERQRVAIARAVLKCPQIYVFDEATSMLDSQTEAALLQDLKQVCLGCTTLIVAHRLSTVQHADEIVVLDKGQVCERGSHAALRAAGGPYARLWRAQMGLDPAWHQPARVPASSLGHR